MSLFEGYHSDTPTHTSASMKRLSNTELTPTRSASSRRVVSPVPPTPLNPTPLHPTHTTIVDVPPHLPRHDTDGVTHPPPLLSALPPDATIAKLDSTTVPVLLNALKTTLSQLSAQGVECTLGPLSSTTSTFSINVSGVLTQYDKSEHNKQIAQILQEIGQTGALTSGGLNLVLLHGLSETCQCLTHNWYPNNKKSFPQTCTTSSYRANWRGKCYAGTIIDVNGYKRILDKIYNSLRERYYCGDVNNIIDCFPHLPTNITWRLRQLNMAKESAKELKSTDMYHNGVLVQQPHKTAAGNDLCLSYHPQRVLVTKSDANVKSALQMFRSEAGLVQVIKNTIAGFGHINDNLVAENCYLFGKSWITNFQPLVVVQLIRKYVVNTKSVYWDPCGGWGGRMLGAYLSDRIRDYICCEPAELTCSGLQQMACDIKSWSTKKFYANVRLTGAEEVTLPAESVDFVFTSPPYYDIERYSNEPTQSWKRFSTFDDWTKGFLQPLMTNAYRFLKPDRYCLINVKNTPSASDNDLEEATKKCAAVAGFRFREQLGMVNTDDKSDQIRPPMKVPKSDEWKRRVMFEKIFVFHKI
jgi:hypothetical protein